jgi:hypothetical protein
MRVYMIDMRGIYECVTFILPQLILVQDVRRYEGYIRSRYHRAIRAAAKALQITKGHGPPTCRCMLLTAHSSWGLGVCRSSRVQRQAGAQQGQDVHAAHHAQRREGAAQQAGHIHRRGDAEGWRQIHVRIFRDSCHSNALILLLAGCVVHVWGRVSTVLRI